MLPTAAQPTSLLDGLLTRDPRVQYPTVLPLGVLTEPDLAGSLLAEQRTVLAMPELARGLIEGITAPQQVRQGKMDPMTGAMLTAGAAPVGGLLARAPAGAVGMNAFHGTPHKFAPEPGFPQGRPRLDMMGTGEGAQVYGPGFYSAEAPGTARAYADQIAYDRRMEMGEADSAHVFAAKDFFRHGEDAEAGLRVAYPDISDKELRAALMEASGNAPRPQTYKLDIPDADAAKLLDYDAPISQQPKVVQDAIDRLGFMPDNPDEMAGGDVWYRMRQQLGEDGAAAAMREAGVPGLRYFDQKSRGARIKGLSPERTRNFLVWDQDVLDRTQILQRNDENFLPTREARENLATVLDANTIGGRVIGDETVSIDTLAGGASSSKRSQDAINEIAEQMRGPDGYIERLIVDQDGNVIEGAHRLEALRKLGITDVPITRIVDPTANLNLPAIKQAIKAAGPINSDNVNQIAAQVAEMLADVGGDTARVRAEYVFPQGFEKFFDAALRAASRQGGRNDEALFSNAKPAAAAGGLLNQAARLTNDDPGYGEPLSSTIRPARGGGKTKHYKEAAEDLGLLLTDEEASALRKEAQRIERLRYDREMGQRKIDPLATGAAGLKSRLADKKRTEAYQAKRDAENARIAAKVAEVDALVDQKLWRKDFGEKVKRGVELDYLGKEAARANLEAIPRLLKKEGWTVRHASKSGGRASSRYLVSPDGEFEVRVSDHDLPMTPQREYSQSLLGTRWSDELIVDPTVRSPKDYVDEIKEMYRAYMSDEALSANPAPAAIPGLLMGNPAMTQQQMQSLLSDPFGA